jgi:hypothetical protein
MNHPAFAGTRPVSVRSIRALFTIQRTTLETSRSTSLDGTSGISLPEEFTHLTSSERLRKGAAATVKAAALPFCDEPCGMSELLGRSLAPNGTK